MRREHYYVFEGLSTSESDRCFEAVWHIHNMESVQFSIYMRFYNDKRTPASQGPAACQVNKIAVSSYFLFY